MSETIRLNDKESSVLAVLAEAGGEDSDCGFLGFKGIAHDMPSLDRRTIRRACRSLARKGLARYARGLWKDDGSPAGSGYCATREGVALRQQIETAPSALLASHQNREG